LALRSEEAEELVTPLVMGRGSACRYSISAPGIFNHGTKFQKAAYLLEVLLQIQHDTNSKRQANHAVWWCKNPSKVATDTVNAGA